MIIQQENSHKNFLEVLDDLSKSRTAKKKEEYLKKLKEKKMEKKKKKKKENKAMSKIDLDDIDGIDISLQNDVDKINKNKISEIEQLLREENAEFEYIDEFQIEKPKFYENFKSVFEYFVIPQKEKKDLNNLNNDSYDEEDHDNDQDYLIQDYDEIPGTNINELHTNLDSITKLSKKKRKLLNRMKISELKQLTDFPQVVEAWDVTAQDPILLVMLKSMKNTVPVPKHWSQKRKFLQNKRGILKQPFTLPDYIEATGISKIRDNTGAEKKAMKQKLRERMQPKLGKMDIDYQVLHDAFFRYQTKPDLSLHGDVYYENREYESKMKIYKPGRITEKLRVALGIPENSPPPWIINMQRYGPPSAYPNLKIPGVNAPICDPTAEITPNLWTPPVNEHKPILVYNFSINKSDVEHWGDLREINEDEYSEDLDEDVSVSDQGETRPSVENIFSGIDIDLSSDKTEKFAFPTFPAIGSEAVPNPNANIIIPKPNESNFFTVLEQKTSNIKQNEIYGSSHTYVISKNNDDSSQIQAEEEIGITNTNTTSTITANKETKKKKPPTFKF